VGEAAWLQVHGEHTCFYENDLLIESARGDSA
jgi:hypothetical protein